MIILNSLLKIMPFNGLLVITIFAVLASMEVGYLLGKRRWRRDQKKSEHDPQIGTLVGAMLGLLAFILGFTFSLSSSYFESRRAEVLKESNAIGTAYLRTGFLTDPIRSESRKLLREYVNLRMVAVDPKKMKDAIVRSEQIHDALWAQAEGIPRTGPVSVLSGLYVQALNEVIDIHSERLMEGFHKKIPQMIWFALYFVMIASMIAVGYQFGLDGARSLLITFSLALTFSAVMMLIADLDNPGKGLMKTNQWSMVELQKKLNADV
jgi:hypothetical protein